LTQIDSEPLRRWTRFSRAYHSQARIYRDVVVHGPPTTPRSKTGVTTVFNNDHDNTSKLGAGKDKEYIEGRRGKLLRPKGAPAVRPALLEREHDERPEPLRRSGGLRHARK